MSRKTDRRHALCLIFARDFRRDEPFMPEEDLAYYAQCFAEDVLDCGFSELAYVHGLYDGVFAQLDGLDERIAAAAESWDIGRISKMDLAIMRMATYEMFYMEEVSSSVAINEAIEIAKEFSDDDSYKFVNGVLEKIRRQKDS